MKYGSVCSGIEAASVAWHPLGWEASFLSEIEPFPRAVLKHHYPDTPVHGDFTTIGSDEYDPIDLLVGGTPCQSFSIAGLRKGLDDERGNLALEFLKLAQRTRPRWVVWENVPGVLSSSGGRDFGAFLGGLGECGYGFAYRVLDAQYFGVAQRRRRVFVVGYLGDWRPPAAVLFERESMSGHPAPCREARENTAGSPGSSTGGGGWPADVAQTLDAKHAKHAKHHGQDNQHINGGASLFVPVMSSGQANAEICNNLSPALNCNRDGAPIALTQYGEEVAGTLTAMHDSSPCADRGQNAVALPLNTQVVTRHNKLGERTAFGLGKDGDPSFTLGANHHHAVAFTQNQRNEVRTVDVPGALSAQPGMKQQTYLAQGVSIRGREGGGTAELSGDISTAIRASQGGGDKPHVLNAMAVRRLTPVECERLQGFPDWYTAIPWRNKPVDNCPDGPRYKALGNSMAVPCMRWIGERIQQVQDILTENKAIEIVGGMHCGKEQDS